MGSPRYTTLMSAPDRLAVMCHDIRENYLFYEQIGAILFTAWSKVSLLLLYVETDTLYAQRCRGECEFLVNKRDIPKTLKVAKRQVMTVTNYILFIL